MNQDWEIKDFEDCLDKVPSSKKIPKKKFLTSGKYPIISQEKTHINGYWDNPADLLIIERPVVIFGDHTKTLKYIDFDFVKGADGVKVFLPIKNINPLFFFYQLKSISLDDLGYARHYRLLKKIQIKFPSMEEQKIITAKLDDIFAAIDTAKLNVRKNLKNSKELFQSTLNEIFSQKGEIWVEKKLGDIALDFGRGKSRHRPRNDPMLYGGAYPFIQTGDVRNSHKMITSYSNTYNKTGLAQSKLWDKGTVCITIAANIAETAVLDFPGCFPDSIIGFVADQKTTSNYFVYYLLQYYKAELKILGKGNAQDNINLGTFEKTLFPIPTLDVQKQIVKKLDKLKKHTLNLKSQYQQELKSIEELKKSILKKAFEGAL